MFEAALAEKITRRQPGVATADDDRIDLFVQSVLPRLFWIFQIISRKGAKTPSVKDFMTQAFPTSPKLSALAPLRENICLRIRNYLPQRR
jgi:hypothetical protein